MTRPTDVQDSSDPQWWLADALVVPAAETPGCCRVCRGTTPAARADLCDKCGTDWRAHPEYESAMDLVAPCTVTVSPSRWYSALWGYKQADPAAAVQAAALRTAFIDGANRNRDAITAALGGAADLVTVVPSTTTATPTPLLRLIQPIRTRAPIRAVAHVRTGQPVPQRQLVPDLIDVDSGVRGRCVIVVEDTWVSGSRAVSTAIALRRAGATTIVVIPVARMTYTHAMTDQYAAAAQVGARTVNGS